VKRKRKVESEFRRRREAKERAERALAATKQRYGIAPVGALKGVVPDPLAAKGWVRQPKAAPTSDRIPGSAPVKDLIHAHKWKRGAKESEATVAEIRRKAAQIGPAYNKGALQYLPSAGVPSPRKRRD
jgi:hypothetical protein